MICPLHECNGLRSIPGGTVYTTKKVPSFSAYLCGSPHAFYLCDNCGSRLAVPTPAIHSGDCVRLCHLSLPSRYPNPVRLNFAALIRRAVSQHSTHHTARPSRVTFVGVNIHSGLSASHRGQYLSINTPCESTIMIELVRERENPLCLQCSNTSRQICESLM